MTNPLLALLWKLYALFVFGLFFSVADQPLGRLGILPVSPTIAAILSLFPFLLAAIVRSCRSGRPAEVFLPIRRNWGAISAFGAVVFFSLLLSILPGSFWNEDGKWILLIGYGFALMLLALFVPAVKEVKQTMPLCIITALGLLVWSLTEDFNKPGTYSLETARAAGFPGNANFAALVSVMLCAAGLDYHRRRPQWIDLVIIALTGLMVIGTMSRSGLINFAVLLGVYCYFRLLRDGFRAKETFQLISGVLITVVTLTSVVPLFTSGWVGLKQPNRIERFLNNKQVDDGSAASRYAAAKDSLRRINESPLLGNGTGFSRSMPELPHNLYLQQWVNNGVPGLLSFIALLITTFITFRRRDMRSGQAFIAVTTVGAIFSHNILDQRPFLILLGILLGGSVKRGVGSLRRS